LQDRSAKFMAWHSGSGLVDRPGDTYSMIGTSL
jgi:hypothetical protein